MTEERDILLIGAGPVGLFGLYCAGLHHMQATLIERLNQVGGQLEHLYPEKPIYDVGGFPRVTGRELISRLKEQAFQFPATVYTGETVHALEREGDRWVALTDKGSHRARTILITAGIGEFIPRKFNNPAIDDYEGHGLYYVVNRLQDFRDRRVLVVGGGDSSADWAMAISDIARDVTMIHRRSHFQCHEDSLSKLRRAPRVTLVPHAELNHVIGDGRVEAVEIYFNDRKTTETKPMDAVIVAIGLVPGTHIMESWGLKMAGSEIAVDSTMATNLPGVYAAGDVATYPGKVKLIASGFGEVATAVEAARRRCLNG